MHPRVRIGVGRPPPPPPPQEAPPSSAPAPRHQQHPPSARHAAAASSSRLQFARPPLDPAGTMLDASDRPLLCCSLQGREVVVGGADHALYCYDAATGRPTRRLYGQRHGHIDWVSTATHLPDGRVLSGGGDGKLCLWPHAHTTSSSSYHNNARPPVFPPAAASVPTATCQDLDGHASAVSKVAAVPESARLAFSAGYDGTVKLWDCVSRRLLTCLDAGRPRPGALDPVVDFGFGAAHLLSGARSGAVHLWDLASGILLSSVRGAHQGQVTCVLSSSPSTFLTGGQDGRIAVWDTRAAPAVDNTNALACVHRVECHANAARGTAAVACLEAAGAFVCSGGADGRVCVLEPRAGFWPVHTFDHHRGAPVCALMAAAVGEEGQQGGGPPVLFSGGSDGILLCYDLSGMALAYGLHANRGAVRCLAVSRELGTVVAAGDDGKALLYAF